MSTAYQGNYSTNLYNQAKRFKLNAFGQNLTPVVGFQKSVPLCDSELREIGDIADGQIRQLVNMNFPRGSSINNGFKVIQSASDTVNNFSIMGGDGSVMGAGVLVIDGYIAFIKSTFEYKNQNATGSLTDDAYTKTLISALTTPGSDRTDLVYVDLYFAEVSANTGSEYYDASLIVPGLGTATSNRVRQVQDIRVSEGGSVPSNSADVNGIYHRYVKIATINRLASNVNILTSMITDNRILINSLSSYSLGTTITDLRLNGKNFGNSTHRANVYSQGIINHESTDFTFAGSSISTSITIENASGKWGFATQKPKASVDLQGSAGYVYCANAASTCKNLGISRRGFEPLGRPQVLNLATTDPDLKGFIGGFTDGRYGYFVPNNNGALFGKVARVDLYDFSTVTVLNLVSTDADLKGFVGGFTDGRYGYFVPYNNGAYFGKVARVDLSNFSTVSVLDLSTTDPDLKGFYGAFTDGKYGYFQRLGPHGKIARVNLDDFSTVSVLNLALTDSELKLFIGGFTDGTYLYFAPNNVGTSGKIARVNVNDFSTVTVLNLTDLSPYFRGYAGCFTDGRYGYFIPSDNGVKHGNFVRVDLTNFTTAGVTVLDLTAVDSDLKGFNGGFTDGRYAYLVPYYNGTYYGKLTRVDLNNFSVSGVSVINVALQDSDLKGFVGGFTDGKFGYLVPSQNVIGIHGKVVRIPVSNGCVINNSI